MTPYFERAGIVIFHGRAEDVLPLLDDRSVDMVFTSPPYNLGTTTGGGFPMGHYRPDAPLGSRGNASGKWAAAARSKGLAHGYGTYDDALPHDDYVAWQQAILRECWRLLSDTGAVFYNHKPRVLAGRLVTPFAYLPPELEVAIRQVIIWARAGGINFSPAFYLPTHEWIVVLARAAWRLKSKGASGIGDVWQVPQESGTAHPAPFPVGLPARAIETAAPRRVLDPFMGSGSTLRAAMDAGVEAIGVEIEERYCEIAARRLDQLPLFTESAS